VVQFFRPRAVRRARTAASGFGVFAPESLPFGFGLWAFVGVLGWCAVSRFVVSVTDTPKDIPADELPTLFDEYRQVEGSESSVQKGTGLGLSITKKFAELLGGSISVESEVGKGSTFTMRVPTEYQE